MPSAPDATRPVVTFVGRPLDPNKGLVTFLDAIEVILALAAPPPLAVWIIGGDPEEVEHIRILVAVRPRLAEELAAGRLVVWGKIARNALPEFYRRSHVVVMPSLREPFGLVALEAMACGCPVLANRVGGLGDTILADMTGSQVDPDRPNALAAAILLYLRGPAIRAARGRHARAWTRRFFDREIAYGRMALLYTGAPPPPLEVARWFLTEEYAGDRVAALIPFAAGLLGRPVLDWRVIGSRHHILARLETSGGPVALKVFRDRPSLSTAMIPVGAAFPVRTARNFVENAAFHAGNPCVPTLLAANADEGIALFQWVEDETVEPVPSMLTPLLARLRAFGDSAAPPGGETDRYMAALERFLRDRDEPALIELDMASASMNEARQRVRFGIRATHPVAELVRLGICLGTRGWPLTADVADRLRMVLALSLRIGSTTAQHPFLQHGDLAPRHLVQPGAPLLLDTEHSVFAVGELDLGFLAGAAVCGGRSVFDQIRGLRSGLGEAAAPSAIQWMVVFVVRSYLDALHGGREDEPGGRLRRILADLALALR